MCVSVFCFFFNHESKSSGDTLFHSTNGSRPPDRGLGRCSASPCPCFMTSESSKKSGAPWSPLVGSKCHRWEALFRSNLYRPDTPPRPGFLTSSAAAGQRSYIFHRAPSSPPTASTSYRVKVLCEQLRLHTHYTSTPLLDKW